MAKVRTLRGDDGEVRMIELVQNKFYAIIYRDGKQGGEHDFDWYSWRVEGTNRAVIAVSGEKFSRVDLAERAFKHFFRQVSDEIRFGGKRKTKRREDELE